MVFYAQLTPKSARLRAFLLQAQAHQCLRGQSGSSVLSLYIYVSSSCCFFLPFTSKSARLRPLLLQAQTHQSGSSVLSLSSWCCFLVVVVGKIDVIRPVNPESARLRPLLQAQAHQRVGGQSGSSVLSLCLLGVFSWLWWWGKLMFYAQLTPKGARLRPLLLVSSSPACRRSVGLLCPLSVSSWCCFFLLFVGCGGGDTWCFTPS